jgi:Domain of unknown function (DUF4143)
MITPVMPVSSARFQCPFRCLSWPSRGPAGRGGRSGSHALPPRLGSVISRASQRSTSACPKTEATRSGASSASNVEGGVADAPVGLLENFVLSELARQLTWSGPSVRLYHYRDRDQYEVDGVLKDNAARSSASRSAGHARPAPGDGGRAGAGVLGAARPVALAAKAATQPAIRRLEQREVPRHRRRGHPPGTAIRRTDAAGDPHPRPRLRSPAPVCQVRGALVAHWSS